MVLRSLLLLLSHMRWLGRCLAWTHLSRRMVRRFVAGETLAEALLVCRRLQSEGIQATLDHLGEHVTSAEEAAESRDACLEALREVHKIHVPATVSIKLTQFGLEIDDEVCRQNLVRLFEDAREAGLRVEIDMEASTYVDRTLALAREMHARFRNVRVALQAYLYRTEQDAEVLCAERIPVRLCKGAYKEPARLAYPRKADVDRNYSQVAKKLLEQGVEPAIATHDEDLIEDVREFAYRRRIPRSSFEFQMLYGIRRDLQERLVRLGYPLRLYVPYGKAWYQYFMRRLAERPANLVFLVKNLFRQ